MSERKQQRPSTCPPAPAPTASTPLDTFASRPCQGHQRMERRKGIQTTPGSTLSLSSGSEFTLRGTEGDKNKMHKDPSGKVKSSTEWHFNKVGRGASGKALTLKGRTGQPGGAWKPAYQAEFPEHAQC